jgi:SAM-dependent methyltransferase
LEIVGVEAFLGGGQAQEIAASRDLLDVSVFPLSKEFRIPFADGTFDLVVSNMVMEHVEDLDFTLSEISRVLKPAGKLLALFPTSEVVREGHCGIPFAHYFEKDSKWRYPYMRIMRGIGLGYFKKGKSQRQWALHSMDWLDKYTAYRSYDDIQNIFTNYKFVIEHYEVDYVNYRLNKKGINLPFFLRTSTLWRIFARSCYRLLGGVVILAAKDVGK